MLRLSIADIPGLFSTVGIGGTTVLGEKSMTLLGGLIASSMSIPILILLLSVFLTLLIGNLVSEFLLKGKTFNTFLGFGGIYAGQIVTYIVLGTIVAYLVFIGLKLPGMLTFIATAIYTFLVALGSAFLIKILNLKV